jgi:hypothetical protein
LQIADAVVALSKAFALAAASELARTIRDEVGFFQAIRAALAKRWSWLISMEIQRSPTRTSWSWHDADVLQRPSGEYTPDSRWRSCPYCKWRDLVGETGDGDERGGTT